MHEALGWTPRNHVSIGEYAYISSTRKQRQEDRKFEVLSDVVRSRQQRSKQTNNKTLLPDSGGTESG